MTTMGLPRRPEYVCGLLMDEVWVFNYAKKHGLAPQPPLFGTVKKSHDEIQGLRFEAMIEGKARLGRKCDELKGDLEEVWVAEGVSILCWLLPLALHRDYRTDAGLKILKKIRKRLDLTDDEEPQLYAKASGDLPEALVGRKNLPEHIQKRSTLR